MTPLETAAIEYVQTRREYERTRHAFRDERAMALAWRRLARAVNAALEEAEVS